MDAKSVRFLGIGEFGLKSFCRYLSVDFARSDQHRYAPFLLNIDIGYWLCF